MNNYILILGLSALAAISSVYIHQEATGKLKNESLKMNQTEGYYTSEIAAWNNYHIGKAGNYPAGTTGNVLLSNAYARRYVAGNVQYKIPPSEGASADTYCGSTKFSNTATGAKTCLQGVQSPQPPPPPPVFKFENIGAGEDHLCGLWQGRVKCRGKNEYGQIGNGSTLNGFVPPTEVNLGGIADAMISGEWHNCVLIGGGVKCWGWNSNGQLGRNSGNYASPNWVNTLGAGSNVTKIAAGCMMTCAIIGGGPSGGTAKCWGRNDTGALGTGNYTDQYSPQNVLDNATGAPLTGIMDIYPYDENTCALLSNGSVKCWGHEAAECATGYTCTSPAARRNRAMQVTGLAPSAIQVAMGNEAVCVLVNGGVQCWGSNYHLGGSSTVFSNPQRWFVPSGSGVVSIAMNYKNMAYIDTSGVLRHLFAAGTSPSSFSTTPIVKSLPSSLKPVRLFKGGQKLCVIADNSDAYCWGQASSGFKEVNDTDFKSSSSYFEVEPKKVDLGPIN